MSGQMETSLSKWTQSVLSSLETYNTEIDQLLRSFIRTANDVFKLQDWGAVNVLSF